MPRPSRYYPTLFSSPKQEIFGLWLGSKDPLNPPDRPPPGKGSVGGPKGVGRGGSKTPKPQKPQKPQKPEKGGIFLNPEPFFPKKVGLAASIWGGGLQKNRSILRRGFFGLFWGFLGFWGVGRSGGRLGGLGGGQG